MSRPSRHARRAVGAGRGERLTQRVEALIIYGSTARWADTLSGPALEFINEYFESGWGSGDFAAVIAPTLSEDDDFHRWFARLERLTATPGVAKHS